MPYITVRYSPNEHHVRNFHRVAEDAYRDTETYIDSNVQWTDREFRSLGTHPSQLTVFGGGRSRLSTSYPPCAVLDMLHALGFPVIAANTDLDGVTTEWTLRNVSHQMIFVRNKMKTEEIVAIPNDDVEHYSRVAEEAHREIKTYIDSSFQWTDTERAYLNSQEGLGPLTSHNHNVDENRRVFFWSCPHTPGVVGNRLGTLRFSVIAENTVGVTTVWTLRR